MGRVLSIVLTPKQRLELETGYKTGDSHCFRQRCRMLLLKADGMKTKDISLIVGIGSENQINGWIKRYKDSYSSVGIAILRNAAGQGRKPILTKVADFATVKHTVQQERQRLNVARDLLQNELSKTFSIQTLRDFLKTLVASTNG